MRLIAIILAAGLLAACAAPVSQAPNVEPCELSVPQAQEQAAAAGFSGLPVTGKRRDTLVASWNAAEPKTNDDPAEVWVFAERNGQQAVLVFANRQRCVVMMLPYALRDLNEVMDGGRPL